MQFLLKKFFPERLVLLYHLLAAYAGALRYGFPSRRMGVIGVTGTKGKTTVANYVWSVLTAAGYKVGLIGTANIRVGGEESLNNYHMTMPGRFVIQSLLARMRRAGCQWVVLEATSEGMKQYRHRGIDFDVAVFTNLTPEHLPSHGGSFANYRRAKQRLFASLAGARRKVVSGKRVPKLIIVNADDEHAPFFRSFAADRSITFGTRTSADVRADNVHTDARGTSFTVHNSNFRTNIPGVFNVSNALPALAIGEALGTPYEQLKSGIEALRTIPGRMERIDEGQPFTVFVDYAHEQQSITAVLNTARAMTDGTDGRVIILLGAEGGGRDKAKRPRMGELSAKYADFVIVSNVDPYRDDPVPILEDIARAAETHGKRRNENLFVIEDRRAGIRRALTLACAHDVVLITGKGAEQSIVINGQSLPWDDRTVVRDELRAL